MSATPEKHQLLPYSFAKRNRVLLTRAGSTDEAAVEQAILHTPDTPVTSLLEAQRFAGRRVPAQSISESEFNQRLQSLYEQEAGEAKQMMDDWTEDIGLQDAASQLPEPEDLLDTSDDAPIIRFINALLAEAIQKNASDVHIEPYENRMVIRLRIDGVLREILQPERAVAPLVISRIKVMARLDIAEKRLPQDGRMSLRVAGRPVDVRVSTLPAGNSERVVLRLLDKQAGRLDISQIAMSENTLGTLEQLIKRPHGILLVTGPTGSGKTTTLYALLNQLNNRQRNIMTVEDPIEYYIDGIGQTQVNPKVDLTFAKGLRAILRQDPDVVMVGEIRDLETADIAVQASLTGHLVLATLHTNTAIGAVTRLRDMGVEPFLLSSSLVGVLSQRLIRLLCTHCKTPYTASAGDLARLGQTEGTSLTLYHPEGCDRCGHSGYVGRKGLFELVTIDDQQRAYIHDGASEQDMEHHARLSSLGLFNEAQKAVVSGETSLEEILRVTQEN